MISKSLVLILVCLSQMASAACLPESIIADEYLIRLDASLAEAQVAPQNSPQTSNKISGKVSSSYSENILDQLSLRCVNCKSFDAQLKKPNASEEDFTKSSSTNFSVQKLSSMNTSPRSMLLVGKIDPLNLLRVRADPRVLSIEPNCRVYPLSNQIVPNDPLFNQQWALSSIRASEGWSVTQGSQKIVVAVSDTGVDYNHPDLRNQMWRNEIEFKGTAGVDDDGNGCVDDIHGCDVADADGDPFPGNLINSGHGTHVAGIIGASANNSLGVAGVAWNVRIMAVKGFYSTESSTTLSALIESIYYAVDNGA
jgi:subtilisin family serine protease